MDPINLFGFAVAAAMTIKALLTVQALERRVSDLEHKMEIAEDELLRLDSELDSRS